MPEPTEGGRFGLYVGTVADVRDPEQRGRVRVRIPDLFGSEPLPAWALPMGQHFGEGSGSMVVPAVGAVVFVQFVQGSVNVPVYTPGAWPQGPREIGHDQRNPPLQHAYPTQRLHWRSRMDATLIETSQGDVTYTNKRRDLTLKFEQGRLNIDLQPNAKVRIGAATDEQFAARKGDSVKVGSLSVTMGAGSVVAVLWHPPDGGPPVTLSVVPTEIIGAIDGGSPSVLIGDT